MIEVVTRGDENMKPIVALLLGMAVMTASTPTLAADIQNLQQRASFAYEEMEQAEHEAKLAAEETAEVEKRLQAAKQLLAESEREVAAAKQKAEKTRAALGLAKRKWNDATDMLEREWKKSKDTETGKAKSK